MSDQIHSLIKQPEGKTIVLSSEAQVGAQVEAQVKFAIQEE
jgi:hypothetical protein